jgi:Skp family chaperone for outer membrane proteins
MDYILMNTIAGKSLLENFNKQEKLKVDKFKISDEDYKNKEKKILAKKNLVTKDEINKELRSLQVEFQNYRKNKIKEIDELKAKRNRNILNFIKLINPIIKKYMSDNSIAILLDKKNIFIASKDYDITQNLVTLINNDIKSIDIE